MKQRWKRKRKKSSSEIKVNITTDVVAQVDEKQQLLKGTLKENEMLKQKVLALEQKVASLESSS